MSEVEKRTECEENVVNAFLDSLDNMTPADALSGGEEKKKKKKSGIALTGLARFLLVAFCIGIFAYCAYQLVDIAIGYKKADDLYNDLAQGFRDAVSESAASHTRVARLAAVSGDKPMKNYASVLATGADIYETPDQPVERITSMRFQKLLVYLESLKQQNPDTFGYIDIKGTKISYPVVQSDDNEYYLRHGFNGSYLKAGAIYADYRNDRVVEKNRNIVLYGHNMQNGAMFNNLESFLDKDFFMNTDLELSTFTGIYTFRVFSIYRTRKDYFYYDTQFDDDEEFMEFCTQAEQDSLFHKEGITFSPDDILLTLSTCITGDESGRYAIHAKLIKVET